MPAGRSKRASKAIAACVDSFLAHRPLLARVVAPIVRPHEIEDVLQETFVRSYAASREQPIRNPRAFMLKTARNIALNAVDRADRKLTSSMEEFVEADVLLERETPDSRLNSEEQFMVFCQAVAALPLKCRRVFILKKIYGLSQKEIAAHLAISTSTVEKHVGKGMSLVAQYMLDRGCAIGRGNDADREQLKDELRGP